MRAGRALCPCGPLQSLELNLDFGGSANLDRRTAVPQLAQRWADRAREDHEALTEGPDAGPCEGANPDLKCPLDERGIVI